MSVNPSNLMAQRANPGREVFPNLARNLQAIMRLNDIQPTLDFVDNQVRLELMAAGILDDKGRGPKGQYIEADWVRMASNGQYKDVPCGIFVAKYRWTFTRAWYYYIAEGPGIPADKAETFHQTWGREVRVNGDCTCRSPLDHNEGFAISLYHIDTAEGLKAFVELLASIYQPRT